MLYWVLRESIQRLRTCTLISALSKVSPPGNRAIERLDETCRNVRFPYILPHPPATQPRVPEIHQRRPPCLVQKSPMVRPISTEVVEPEGRQNLKGQVSTRC
jgi:hypothetical protein